MPPTRNPKKTSTLVRYTTGTKSSIPGHPEYDAIFATVAAENAKGRNPTRVQLERSLHFELFRRMKKQAPVEVPNDLVFNGMLKVNSHQTRLPQFIDDMLANNLLRVVGQN